MFTSAYDAGESLPVSKNRLSAAGNAKARTGIKQEKVREARLGK